MVCNSCQYVLEEGQLVEGFVHGPVAPSENWVHENDDGQTLGRERSKRGPGVSRYNAQRRKVRTWQLGGHLAEGVWGNRVSVAATTTVSHTQIVFL
jgi:hypothetical protein